MGTPFEGIYDEEMSITFVLSEVIRGPHARQMVLYAYKENDEAVEGQEYLLAYGKLNYIESTDPDSLLEIDKYDFESVSNNKVMDRASVFYLEPEFNCELYVGGICEGWIPFIVYKDDLSPLIRFEEELFFAIE